MGNFFKILKPIFTLNLGTSNASGVSELIYKTTSWLLFLPSWIIAVSILALSFCTIIYSVFKNKFRDSAEFTLIILFAIPFIGILFNGVASDAYMPIIFPSVFLIISLFLTRYIKKEYLIAILLLIIGLNTYLVTSNSYYSGSGKRFAPTVQEIRVKVNKSLKSKLVEPNYEYIRWFESRYR